MPCSSRPCASSRRSRPSTPVVVAIRLLSLSDQRKTGGGAPQVRIRSGSAPIVVGGDRTRAAKPAPVDTRSAIDRFLASPGLSEATRRSYRFDLEAFAAWLDARRLRRDEIGRASCRERARRDGWR